MVYFVALLKGPPISLWSTRPSPYHRGCDRWPQCSEELYDRRSSDGEGTYYF